jgi:rRNA maturation RNase YbeY
LKVRIYYDDIAYRLRDSKSCLKLIQKVIRNEKKIPGDLYFIITTDEKLIEINRDFLDHDYYTDVIAFNNNVGKIVNGEVYISIDTVKNNAYNYKVSLKMELLRVMIHGTLHLCGYTDSNIREKEVMRREEDKWLEKVN